MRNEISKSTVEYIHTSCAFIFLLFFNFSKQAITQWMHFYKYRIGSTQMTKGVQEVRGIL